MNKKFTTLWIGFVIYAFCCMTMQINLMTLLSVWGTGLSIYLLMKLKSPSKSKIYLAAILSLLVMVSYLGVEISVKTLLYGAMKVPFVMICSLAMFSVMEKIGGFKLLGSGTKKSVLISVVIAICVGAVLSFVNYLLMKSNNEVDFAVSISRLLVSFNPAILEEITMRGCFMAYCVYAVDGKNMTKLQVFTMWFMMCLPHTMSHGYGIVETVILCLIFGLPFAILQRKRDVGSAMISHGIVLIRKFSTPKLKDFQLIKIRYRIK